MTYCATTYHYSSCRSTDWSASSISGRLSLDANRDNSERGAAPGSFDAGIAGKKVYLIDSYGRVVASTTTGDDGSYKFASLKAGNYMVSFEMPGAGLSFAQKDVGDVRYDSDVNATGKTDWICLAKCQNVCDIDASVQRDVGKITGSVFHDTQCDGINGIMKTIPGVNYVLEAEAMCKSGALGVFSGAQASGGKFVKLQCGTSGTLSDSFDGKSGTYNVVIRVQDENDGRSSIQLKVDGKIVTAIRLDRDNNGGGDDNGGFSDFVIQNVKVNCGSSIQLVVCGDAGEFVRLDKITFQGQPTTVLSPEPPKANVKIVLLDANDQVVATTYTDANGNYKFDNVATGQYKIMGVAPDGTHFTLKDAGTNDAIDSDVGANGKSDLITVVKDGCYDIDLGVCEIDEGSLSGRYFLDKNNNNIDDAGDTGIQGKTVTLYAADGVTVIATTTTGANGEYGFADLEPGNYIVAFQDSTGENRSFVTQNVGANDAIDSDANATTGRTAPVTVVANTETKDVDVGVADNPGSLSGRYFYDANNNAVDNGEAGVAGKTVTLYAADGVTVVGTTTTDGSGNYSFAGLRPGNYIVAFEDSTGQNRSFVAQDQGGDDTVDSDANPTTGRTAPVTVSAGAETKDVDAGVADDPGSLSGRYFYDANNNAVDNGDDGVVGKTVTLYAADGVTVVGTTTTDGSGNYSFTGLRPGNYIVAFEDSTGQNRSFVAQDQGGDDTVDSDADAGTGRTGLVAVSAGAETKDVDVGVADDPGSLSGRYFFDADRSSTDNGDAGVEGKEVTLYAADGVTVIGSTLTDADGNYSFTGLRPGNYIVAFEDSTVEGRQFVAQDQGGDDTVDSDADSTTGRTAPVTVSAGAETKDVDVGVFVPNKAPIAVDDAGTTCADETLVVDLLGNDSDPDGNAISVISISDNDETVGVGGTITLTSGAFVTLNADGTVTYDGIAAYSALTIGQQAVDGFSYTISDGDLTADANVAVTVCGDLNTPESIDERVFDGATANFTVNIFNATSAINGFSINLNSVNIPNDFHVPPLTVANLGGPLFSEAYCIDAFQDITTRIATTANLMVATEANALAVGLTQAAADNIDSVNWILNQHFATQNNNDGNGKNFTDMEVQEAIYILLNGDTFFINNPDFGNVFLDNNNGVRDGTERATAQNAHEIADLALSLGDGFQAGSGDILGLILDPTAPAGQEQPFIFGVQFDLFAEDCLCR